MKLRVKKMWTEALRSGEYSQTQHALKNSGGFCCLGVLTDIYIKAVGGEWSSTSKEDGSMSFDGECTFLHDDVVKWAGVHKMNPLLKVELVHLQKNILISAVNLNDRFGYTFAQIADAIDRTWPDSECT